MKRRRWGCCRSVLSVVILSAAIVGCTESPKEISDASANIDATLEKLLSQYQIEARSINTKKVTSSYGNFTRTERRIVVPAEFNTLEFNRALSARVAECGATAIATEKPEDRIVTMHIKKDGTIVHSVAFILKEKEK